MRAGLGLRIEAIRYADALRCGHRDDLASIVPYEDIDELLPDDLLDMYVTCRLCRGSPGRVFTGLCLRRVKCAGRMLSCRPIFQTFVEKQSFMHRASVFSITGIVIESCFCGGRKRKREPAI
ncbi:uncharacterized protein HELO_2665A [Halomonas elongata DSM 2581]|uniref:Uncharacterized protein n=1 Tax=Halomonas elongata (strain ATCC 33173 / DSM 2581 / NBRC 15536 / NCIMB 2198 / 1H9) TaxID=768066 RepID=A0A1R4A4C1_HALED|nr:uncharacterized protein HELO_2665A [Halomonas elongata DSM 2581]